MMIGSRLSLLWNFIFLVSFTFNNLSEATEPKKLPSAVVVGTVYCDTCFHQDFSKASHFISGALVAVECGERSSRPSFRQVVKTNQHGEFKVHLPFSVSKHVKRIKGCSVKLISSSEPFCAVASTATSSSLRLKSRKEGTHIFSAGFFTFKPLKQPELCDQKPIIPNPKKLNAIKSSNLDPNVPSFLAPIQNPPASDLPPMGQNYPPPLPKLPDLPPLPQLPLLPPLPGIPNIPQIPTSKETKKTSQISNVKESSKKFEKTNVKVSGRRLFTPIRFLPSQLGFPFPPNPLLPPPSILPPNPFLPPPSIVPPLFPSPPPTIFPPIVPSPPSSIIPPILPSPPSPPSSIFPPILPSPPSPPPSIFPPVFPLPGSPPFKFPPLIPGLTPPQPPPSPPPSFPFPLPPFPFQPAPGFPGVPPAVPSSSSSKKSFP